MLKTYMPVVARQENIARFRHNMRELQGLDQSPADSDPRPGRVQDGPLRARLGEDCYLLQSGPDHYDRVTLTSMGVNQTSLFPNFQGTLSFGGSVIETDLPTAQARKLLGQFQDQLA